MKSLSEKKTILIIDDEMDIRFYLKTLVESMGHRPVLTKNGKEGLRILINEKPDLVILDVMMPEKGGALVYKEIMFSHTLRSLPLMIFSGVDRESFIHYLKILNATLEHEIPFPKYYITKTADPEYLKTVICELLNSKKQSS